MKLAKILIAAFFLIAVLESFSQPVYLDETKPLEERIEHALSLMTLEEKVAMTHAQSKFSSAGVPRLGIPEVWHSDGPHGVREEISWDSWAGAGWTNDYCTAFPALTCLAASFNPEISASYGKAIGEEARFREKDVLLGPGVNIYRTPLNGRNFEYMGEDPYLASKMVVPYVKGVQSNGVAACVKHFIANNQEKWRGHIDVQMSDRALNEIYFPPYKASVLEGEAWAFMGAYNKFRGQHCCHNDYLLNKVLKDEWGFDGLVVSDWGGVHNTYEAANYGLDIEMGTYTNGLTTEGKFPYSEYYLANPVIKEIKAGNISETVIDDKVKRILRVIFRTSMNRNRPWGSLETEDHKAVARNIAAEGIVLLKNEAQTLPLDIQKYKRILIVGENATKSLTTGGGSSSLKVRNEISPLVGLQAAIGDKVELVHSLGYSSGPSLYGWVKQPEENQDSLRKVAVELAESVDLVLYFGGLNKNHYQDCEGGDRKSMDLPFNQDQLLNELIAANPNIVVTMISGNAVTMPWVDKVPTLVQAWYLGSEAGHAIADLLTGETNPSGKLPFTFPVKLEDNSAHAFDALSYPGDSIKQIYKEDILVGYRWHDTKEIEPLFPFGFGLSYTSFEIGKAKTNKKKCVAGDVIQVTVPVKNTGSYDGAEVIQAYIVDKKSSVMRPSKELKGFAKVHLEAEEAKEVTIDLPVNEWSFYSEEHKDWVLEPGKFEIWIGNSSRGDFQKVGISLE